MSAVAKVRIQTRRCVEVAEHIRAHGGVPSDVEDPMPYMFPVRIAHNGWCATVAINQQTTPVVGPALRGTVYGEERRGWDYLLQKAIYEANRNDEMFTVPWLCAVTPSMLRSLYHDIKTGDTLNQIEQRAELLRDLGNMFSKNNWQSVNEIYEEADGFILRSDGKGIGQVLSMARAYQDPVQKKLFYFLAIKRNQGFWQYRDPLNLSAPVNYHEQRGHLRLGTIVIEDAELKNLIRGRNNIQEEDDIEIRLAVRRAIEFIAQYLDVTPSAMHYYFWNHIRNCCNRDNPHCSSCENSCKLPERYRSNDMTQCVFSSTCPSANLPLSEKFIEPRIDHTIWQ